MTLTKQPTAMSSMHYHHLDAGAEMVTRGGWVLPSRYSTVDEELECIKRTVGLADISHFGKLRLQGELVELDLGKTIPGYGGTPRGFAVVTSPNKEGLVVARLASDEYLIVTRTGHSASVAESITPPGCAHLVDVTSDLGAVRVIGPNAAYVLDSVDQLDLEPEYFPNLSCTQGKVADIHCTIVRRDIGGILSYDLFFGRYYGDHMWESLVHNGLPHGLAPVGMEAMGNIWDDLAQGNQDEE